MSTSNRAAVITPPVAGQNVWGFDAADMNAEAWVVVPEAWKGCILELEAVGEAFYYTFGDDTLSAATAANKSTLASNAITAIGSVAGIVPAGQTKTVDLSALDPHYKQRFAATGADGTSGNQLKVTRTSGQVIKV